MSGTATASTEQTKVNDIAITIATVNGSGSQTANSILMRAIFEMGIPVGAKNLFPSNIEGEPTWFCIRANKDGFVGIKRQPDLLIAANPDSLQDDVKALKAGAICLCEESLDAKRLRGDVTFLPVPFAKLAAKIPDIDARIKRMLANMVYAGALAQLLGLDPVAMESAISKQFKGKAKAVNLNIQAMKLGMEHVQKNLPPFTQYHLQRMDCSAGKVIMDGNFAAGLGAVMAGCTVMGWYPITPATGICETFNTLARKYRVEPGTGKATYASIQLEDELASIGCILGAGWAGARSMTATSGPGLSLMAELIGLGYYVEIPTVIFDVQRVGPSTGLPTRTMQSDMTFAALLSHGDTKHIMLIPGSVEECYEMAIQAFDVAEQYQTPVMVMSDLDLGMNNWVCKAPAYPEGPINRGKVLGVAELEALQKQGKKFGRYRDVDGDGVPYRTLPGTNHPQAVYFTRGTGHDEAARYSEDPQVFTRNLDRLSKKIEHSAEHLPPPVFSGEAKSEVGIIAYGSTDAAIPEALALLKSAGVATEYLRLRGYPFASTVRKFLERKKRVYVVEQNRDRQMLQLLTLDMGSALSAKLRAVRSYDGWPVDARDVAAAVQQMEKEK